ncbi:hypothetical protein BBJ29_008748 [Phytophthora kernoviae]|uniref:WRKY19-like zinc finger domain-containing protein n=1 Tax=Phytophthora kernoviae TaxID=325452 RepID=A0A3F2REF2_9STRA|nr:hypothetical protein BBJ29_008748 [Phytophthora kernoviae]RLN54546.1 hypothetical protein BBP00_00008899 [Phytophthora kernoviae]
MVQSSATSTSNSSASAASHEEIPGVNPELLRSMMDCVDTTLFSPAQLSNWSQMKERLRLAEEQNTPVSLTGGDLAMVKNEFAKTPNLTEAAAAAASGQNGSVDFRQPLHREASIQDVLACLLDQQPPSARLLNSGSGGSFLVNSENAKQTTGAVDHKPSLKKLLSSNDFSMTEKKESLRHLLSFIDNSFASNTPEPLTQVYKDCEAGTLQRLSSLQLMRSFMTPNPSQNGQSSTQGGSGQGGMGNRTTSFEIIQAMLNATSNQAIQKPMTSQDSFRFQHLARTLESIETDVAYDNEDYGGDDVVQVDNLDNLLDYHGGNANAAGNSANATNPPPAPPASQGASAGFVDAQTLLNPSRPVYNEMVGTPSVPLNGAGFTTFGQNLDNQHGGMLPKQQPQMRGGHLQQQMRIPANGGKPVKTDVNGTQLCSALGCNHAARVKGMCKLHGGGRRCKVEGCMKSAQTGHLCIAHGGGKPCNVEGCPKTAQSRGLCKQHGGGVRCKFEGCTKSCQSEVPIKPGHKHLVQLILEAIETHRIQPPTNQDELENGQRRVSSFSVAEHERYLALQRKLMHAQQRGLPGVLALSEDEMRLWKRLENEVKGEQVRGVLIFKAFSSSSTSVREKIADAGRAALFSRFEFMPSNEEKASQYVSGSVLPAQFPTVPGVLDYVLPVWNLPSRIPYTFQAGTYCLPFFLDGLCPSVANGNDCGCVHLRVSASSKRTKETRWEFENYTKALKKVVAKNSKGLYKPTRQENSETIHEAAMRGHVDRIENLLDMGFSADAESVRSFPAITNSLGEELTPFAP